MFLIKPTELKKQIGKIIFYSFLLFFIFMPGSVSAVNISFSAGNPQMAVGDTAFVDLVINTEGQAANVIEGKVTIEPSSSIIIRELSVAGSVLTYWTSKPLLSENSQAISFAGGTPGGFNKSNAKIIRIVFSAATTGEIKFIPNNFKIFANDGQATLINTKIESLTLNINPAGNQPAKDHWQDIISGDSQPPTDLTAVIGQDQSMFNGQKYLFISASDDQSGIDYYEVKEGDRPLARSGKIYVLIDQSGKSDILVLAYDKAGNFSQIFLRSGQPVTQATKLSVNTKASFWPLIIFIAVLVLIIFLLIKIIKRLIKKNKKKNGGETEQKI